MRFSTKPHQFYCGIALHARTMSRGIVSQDGAMLGHRNMPAGPAPFLKAVAPSREDLVVCGDCLFPWDWLADLWARDGLPCVLGHALSMQAIHGGKAKNAPIDAPKIAVRRRGGMRPQAYVSPAEMRATRDRRRRRPRMRTRAELLTPVQHTNGPDTVPEIGTKSASKAKRAGVAARFPAPAVQQSIAVARALIDDADQLLRALALTMLQTAKQHDAQTLSLLQTVHGLGKRRSRVLLSARHAMARFPRVQDVGSSCRLVTWVQESAGKHDGPSGTKIGHASLTWACSAAALLGLRTHPAGHTSLAR
jgi:transposase